MNKLTVICLGLIVGGCANTDQLAESNAKLDALNAKMELLENRLTRIETDLYKIEPKKAPAVSLPKPVLVKELEPSVQEIKIKALIKECLGAEFGDENSKYPNLLPNASGWVDLARVIPVIKKIGYFDKAFGFFEDGKLYSVSLYMEVDKKYSYDSVNLQYEQTVADIAATVGVDPVRLKGRECDVGNIRIDKATGLHDTNKLWRKCLTFGNNTLRRKFEKEKRTRKNAKGETLPPPK